MNLSALNPLTFPSHTKVAARKRVVDVLPHSKLLSSRYGSRCRASGRIGGDGRVHPLCRNSGQQLPTPADSRNALAKDQESAGVPNRVRLEQLHSGGSYKAPNHKTTGLCRGGVPVTRSVDKNAFTAADIRKAIKAAEAGGKSVAAVDFPKSGGFRLLLGSPVELAKPARIGENEWDEVLVS